MGHPVDHVTSRTVDVVVVLDTGTKPATPPIDGLVAGVTLSGLFPGDGPENVTLALFPRGRG
jgi:hypothetical protein